MGPNIVEISRTAPFPYLLIIVKAIVLQLQLFNCSWWYENLKSVSNALSADDKYSPFNGENLTQPVQMQESPKKKLFFVFFFSIFEI